MSIKPVPRAELTAMNSAFVLPDIPHISERVREARELAAQHPEAEQAFIVDRRTGAVIWRGTDNASDSVDIKSAADMGLVVGNLIVHTHPIPAELSEPDVECATICMAYGNMAVSPDGTVSWTTGADRHRSSPRLFEQLSTRARLYSGYEEEDNDPSNKTACARDNYWIARAIRPFLNGYWVHYSPSLIDSLSDPAQ